jgi:hypothetical protein
VPYCLKGDNKEKTRFLLVPTVTTSSKQDKQGRCSERQHDEAIGVAASLDGMGQLRGRGRSRENLD